MYWTRELASSSGTTMPTSPNPIWPKPAAAQLIAELPSGKVTAAQNYRYFLVRWMAV